MTRPICLIGSEILQHLGGQIIDQYPPALALVGGELGLTLIPPTDNSVFLGSPEQSILFQAPCSVVLEQLTASRTNSVLSGSGNERSEEIVWPIRIRVLFSIMGYEPRSLYGRVETQQEHFQALARAYEGALLEALYGYGEDGDKVQMIRNRSSLPLVEALNEGQYVGGCVQEWEVTSRVFVPSQQ